MRSFIYVAVSAFAALAAAQKGDNAFNVPSGGYDFTAGEPTTLSWDPTTSGTVTLKLQVGKDNITPDSGEIIAENIPNSGTFSFVPPNDVQPGTDYTVEIIDDNNPDNYNFTPTFTVDTSSNGQTSSVQATTTEAVSTTASDATTTAASTETGSETTATATSSGQSSGTTMVTTSSASGTATGTATTSATGTDSESSTGTATTDTPGATTTAPGAGASLKVQGSMFAVVAAAMFAL